MRLPPPQLRNGLTSAVLSFGFAIAFAAGLHVASGPAAPGVAMIWLANGFLAAAFLRLPASWAWTAAALSMLAALGLHRLHGTPPIEAAVYPLIDLCEALATAWLARRVCGEQVRLDSPLQLARLVGLAVGPAAAGGAVLAANVSTILGRSFDHVLMVWLPANVTGSALVLPLLLIMVEPLRPSATSGAPPR